MEAVSGKAVIRVRTVGYEEPHQFEVVVHDSMGGAHFQVTMRRTDFDRLNGDEATSAECIRAAFLFLLDRESKESILPRFDVSVIERYFPDFFDEFARYRAKATKRGQRNDPGELDVE